MAGKIAKIEVRMRELAQLFNSIDPSPFLDRDLDADAEEFIVSWAREHPKDRELELVVHLTTPVARESGDGLEAAVQHYFDLRAEMKRREFRRLLRRGWRSLVIGLLFLAGCFFLGGLLAGMLAGSAAEVLREGLTIFGWVAMWRPLEIYLYDWWPVREELRLFARLARMRVQLVLPS